MDTTHPSDPPMSFVTRALLGAVCVVFVLLSARTSWLLPMFEGPDEFEHYEVVRHYALEGWLPNLAEMPQHALDEGVQPPLAYLAFAVAMHGLDAVDDKAHGRRLAEGAPGAALFFHGPDERRPYRGLTWKLHVLRLLNLLPGIATILLTAQLARRLAPHRDALAVGAASIVAFNPQFGAMCGSITNGPLAFALCTGALVQAVTWSRTRDPSDRQMLLLGLTIGTALIAKLSATFLIPTVGVGLLMRHQPLRVRVTQGYMIAIGIVLVAGPWFVWNAWTYGDPLAWGLGESKFGLDRRELTDTPTWRLLLMRYIPRSARTYAALFGATASGGPLLRTLWLGVALTVAVGLARLAVSKRLRTATVPPEHGTRFALLATAIGANVFASITFYMSFNQAQGRYLFPTIAPTAVLIAVACAAWMRPLVSSLGLAVLGASILVAQHETLTPSFWPLNRQHDDTFALATPHGQRTPETTIAWRDGGHAIESFEPPELRWIPESPNDRYTLRLTGRGFGMVIDLWRDAGVTAHDRFVISQRTWSSIPPGVTLLAQVHRLATTAERDEGVVPPATSVREIRRRMTPNEAQAVPDVGANALLPPPAPVRRIQPSLRLSVRTGDVAVEVDDGGKGAPTLVCLPAADETLGDWEERTRDLRDRRRVVLIDLDHDASLTELARRVRDIFDVLLIDRAVILAHGRAADVALTLADDITAERRLVDSVRVPNAPPPDPPPIATLVVDRPHDAPIDAEVVQVTADSPARLRRALLRAAPRP